MEYLEEVAVQNARSIADGKLKVQRKKSLVDRLVNIALMTTWGKDQIFKKAKNQVMKASGGLYPAPLKVLVNCKVKCCWIITYFIKFETGLSSSDSQDFKYSSI